MAPIRLLYIIDDDPIYRFTVSREISYLKMAEQIREFPDGRDAIEYLNDAISEGDHSEIPDLLLLDINMPVMSGWEFLDSFRALVASDERTPAVYMVSSSVNREDLERAEADPMIREYITKPMSRTKLAALSGPDIRPAS